MRAVAYCGTRGVYRYMIPSIKSLLTHTKVDTVYLFIEDDYFPEYLPRQCEVVNVSGQRFFSPTGQNYSQWWTWMAMMKCTLTKLLPDLDRILYLDIDTIVVQDLAKLWELDLEGRYMAAVREPEKSVVKPYYNTGVIMLNLDKIRKDGADDILIRKLNKQYYEFPDQDAMNEVFEGRVLDLQTAYNHAPAFMPSKQSPKVIHYAAMSKERWITKPRVQKYDSIPWEVITE